MNLTYWVSYLMIMKPRNLKNNTFISKSIETLSLKFMINNRETAPKKVPFLFLTDT